MKAELKRQDKIRIKKIKTRRRYVKAQILSFIERQAILEIEMKKNLETIEKLKIEFKALGEKEKSDG